jgi:flagellar hook-associated protein 1 FlgK
MTLLGTLQTASNSIQAASLGLQVVGNNIANANNPDYIRQRLVQNPAPAVHRGGLLLGLGTKVEGVVQVLDQFLADRLRAATSDVARSQAQADAYSRLEAVIHELGDNDLSSTLTAFFGSLNDVLNQPESTSVRNIAVQKGQALADMLHRMDRQARDLHQDLDQQIAGQADEINRLLQEIAKLNVQIVQAEGGSVSPSDAVGLRDRRAAALSALANITNIQVVEQPTGDVAVYSGGDYLVMLGTARQVGVVQSVRDGLTVSEIQVQEIHSPLAAGGGKLAGLQTARDEVVGGFIQQLDQFTATLIREFNKIHAGGQGLTGFSDLTAQTAVSDPGRPLDSVGLAWMPTTGLFQVQILNTQTNERRTAEIHVDLDGLDSDTTLASLAAQLDAIDGLSATVGSDGRLRLTADAPQLRFAFAGDTSGVLASLGLNTFFTGTKAGDIGIHPLLRSDPGKLAVARGGPGEDTDNGLALASLLTTPLAGQNGASLATLYDRLTGNVAQASQTAQAAAEGFRYFQQTLQGQHLAVSGVNLDEEAVRMIEYQRVFQASARVVATVNELLQTLLNL